MAKPTTPGHGKAPKAAAVIVAAGESKRMSALQEESARARKPFLRLYGLSVLEHTLAAFDGAEHIEEIILVCHPDDQEDLQKACAEKQSFGKVRVVVPGGEQRADSVREGVRWTSFEVDVIAIHDAARPLIESECIDRSIQVAADLGAAVVALPVTDTIKTSSDFQRVEKTLDRSVLWSAQTPQAFQAKSLRDLLDRAQAEGFRPTDDAAIYERYVGPVPIVRGHAFNFKLTTPEDLVLAEAVLRARGNGRRTKH